MLDLFDEFKALVLALEANRIDYAVCGGLALAVHALARATIDIDLLVVPADLERVQAVAGQLGFTIPAAPMSFQGGAVEIRRLSKLDDLGGDLLMLDLLLVTPAIDKAWAGRQPMAWEYGTVWVVSREGLALLKSLRGSGQDQEDIKRLSEKDED